MWEGDMFEYAGGLVWALVRNDGGGYVVERRGSDERKVVLNHLSAGSR